ncbi:Uncharacterized protein EJ110_NYTH22510 [Nymphaea thermarum]|nr:Uncharacterized protein EJ110_NYTH22510 [Nymphaea thermarum]
MEQLVNFIIRPPRAEYTPDNDLLEQKFMLKGRWYQRKDIKVKNSRGLELHCSHYMPLEIREGKALPCVIYCHGNSGSRVDASEAAIILLPSYITVFTLDFSGSGLSEGEHVTLGWNEKDDLKAVVNYLRTEGNVSLIGLWGRSMGAVTSLLYGAEDPSIAGMVLDSPFANLIDLMMELVDTYKIRLPKFTVKVAIHYMRRVVQKKANFDIGNLNAVEVAKSCFVPALFGHATEDDFIQPHHSDRIYDTYAGDKNIIKFDGDHNSQRPQFYFDSITIFFHNVLHPPTDAADGISFPLAHEYYFDQVPLDIRGQEEHLEDASQGVNCSSLDESDSYTIPFSHSALGGHSVGSSYGSVADFPYSVEDEERMLSEAIMLSLKEMNIGSTSEDPMSGSSEDPCQTDDSVSAGRSTSPTEGPSFEGTAGGVHSLVVCESELKTLSDPKNSVTTVHAEPPSVTDCQTRDPVLSKSSLPASESHAEQLKSSSTGCLCNGDLSAQQQHLDRPADANALLPKNM